MELVPDLMVALRTAPAERPSSALKSAVWTLNSWIASTGGEDDEVGAVEEVGGVGVVVDAVEQVVVLRGWRPLAVKAPEAALPRLSACATLTPALKLGEEGEVATVERAGLTRVCSSMTCPTEDSSACSCGGAVETVTLFRGGAGLEADIDLQFLTDGDGERLLGGGGEAGRGDRDLIVADTHRGKGVIATAGRGGGKGAALVRILEGDGGVGDNGTRCILHDAGDGTLVNLGERSGGADEQEAEGGEERGPPGPEPPKESAYDSHPKFLQQQVLTMARFSASRIFSSGRREKKRLHETSR